MENWYLKNLTLKYFQIHKKIVLNFTKGLNVLIGETDSGKSAIMRALRLGLMNTPRSGEKEYQSDFSSDKPYIEINDSRNNKIVRTNRTYKINEKDPLSAFNADVPAPLKKLFPLTPINVQHQIDPHFLILDTGGKAGKIISKAIGLEDQQLYLDEIKRRMAEGKRSIRAGEDNIKEYNRKLKELESIPILFEKANSIKEKISYHDELNESLIIPLQDLLQNLDSLIKEEKSYPNLDRLNSMHESILDSLEQYKQYREETDQLKNILNQIYWFNKSITKINSITNKLKAVPQLILRLKSVSKTKVLLNGLNQIITTIEQSQQKLMSLEMEVDTINMEYENMLIEAGQCPFCGADTKRKNQHECSIRR